ncbi:pyridoxal-5'-phosphate-dependent protein subunit beta [Paraburkholderia steynii]|uniref:Pyridoxal-5'-phosphate-dependent protein subunit beta n=1 Tax=Paraburkholderia steynii TaxID=1245441 RepID=A0A4R0X6Q3_9BURK|nr:pyridoxal-5'-phosphate-dependent protein subunit beta [Paraburkholderia steynii]
MPSIVNPNIRSMQCIRCNASHPVHDYFEGCPCCLARGDPASVAPRYTAFPPELTFETLGHWLCYPDVSGLGEGKTPLSTLPRVAAELGIRELHSKNEFTNPTGSHKDRMAALLVQRAQDIGVKTIAVASSGNAGASVAAYAARAGLGCVVITTPDISPNWRNAIEMYGAEIIATENADDRWMLVAQHVQAGDWYPATNYTTPPVGSNPFGVDGYRAIAFELYLQLCDAPPTDIVVPTARGDLLWGIAKGYCDLRDAGLLPSIPKIHAVEPYPRIEHALQGRGMVIRSYSGDTAMGSIGGNTVTHQTLTALQQCGSSAVSVNDNDAFTDQRVLGREGLYLELASIAPLCGLRELVKSGKVGADSRVVLISTSHGYKETAKFTTPLIRNVAWAAEQTGTR